MERMERTTKVDKSKIKTILIGHSMGGIIAADSLLAMADENDPTLSSIIGLLAYDTPYFGLNPPVIQRTITTRANAVSSAVNSAREWVPQGLFASKASQAAVANQPAKSSWSWGRTAAAVGVGVAAVGALTYFAKDPIVNHLQFVSVLYKSDELSRRMKRLSSVRTGFRVFYTSIVTDQGNKERTFCNLPVDGDMGRWIRQENGLAKDEVEAHCGMFSKSTNDHFDDMVRESIDIIRTWIG
jgi:pimeloyl-ACP methyl ester carboxylesterase